MSTIYVNQNWTDVDAFNADTTKQADAVWGETAFATFTEAVAKAEADTIKDTIVINGNVNGKDITKINTDIVISGSGTIDINKSILTYGNVTFKDADISFSPIDHNVGLNVRNGGSVTLDNSDVNIGYFYVRGNVNVVNRSKFNCYYVIAPGAEANEEKSAINVVDSEFIIDANNYNLGCSFGSASDNRTIEVNIINGKLNGTTNTTGIYIASGSTITADTDSLITAANKLENNGSIVIDANGAVFDGSKTIIESGNFTGNSVSGKGVEVTVDANGDIVVSDNSIVVDDSWDNIADGTQVAFNGKNYTVGVNAFSTVSAAVAATSAGKANTIYIAGGTYTEDITLDARSMEQKGDINFVAADGAEVILTGKVTIGYYEKRVGSKAWNANVAFENIIFDQAAAEAHSIDIQQVKDFSMTNCTVIGDGEYGISGTNVDNGASIIGCIFTNAGIQSAGNFGTNLLIDQCVFNTSKVNIQSGNSVLIKGSTFNAVLNDSNVGDSFYCVRSNDNAITIENTVFNIDSKLTGVAADQAKWGVLWQRGVGGTKWQLTDIKVNYTDAAMAQTELLFNKNGTTTAANEAGRVTIDGITSTTNNIDDILAKSEGMVNVDNTLYDDGSKVSTDKLYVNSDWTAASTLDAGRVYGVNAFGNLTDAFAAAENNSGSDISISGDGVVGQPQTAEGIEVTTPGVYNVAGTEWANIGYIQLNPSKAASDTRYVMNITDANLVATKLQGRRSADINITNSHVDFADNTSRGYVSIYTDSTFTIKDSVVGYDAADGNSSAITAGRDSAKVTNSDPANAVYIISGEMTAENSTVFAFSHEGGSKGGFVVTDRGLISFKNSAVYAGSIAIAVSDSDDKKTVGRDNETATMIFDNSVLYSANSDTYGLWIGYSSGLTGGLIVRNNSEINYGDQVLNIGAGSYASVNNSTVDFSKISNKGSLLFTDSAVDGQTIIGDGSDNAEMNVEGGSFSNSKVTDLFSYFHATTITNSEFTGSRNVYSGYGLVNNAWDYATGTTVTLQGTVEASTKTWYNYAGLNIADGAVFNVNYYGDTSRGETVVNGTINATTYRGYNGIVNEGGKISATYLNLYGTVSGGKFTINGTAEADNMLIGFETMTQPDGQGGYWNIGGANNILNLSGANASVTVAKSATVQIDNENYQAVLNISDGASFSAATLTNNGIINIAGGTLTAGTLANAGTITVDAAGYTAGSYKVVDTDTFTGSDIVVKNLAAGMSVIKAEDGDIIITDNKYYVNPEWNADSDLAAGMIYGTNAFATVDEYIYGYSTYADRNTAAIAIDFATGSTLNTAAGKTFYYTDSDVTFTGVGADLYKADRFYLMDTLIANGEAADKAAADAAAANLATVTIAEGTTIKTNMLNVGQAIDSDDVDANGNVTRDFAAVNLVINGTLDQGNLYVNSYSTVTVSKTGKVTDNNSGGDSHIRANGKLIVNGTGKDGDVQFAGNWYKIRGGEMLFNSTNATTGTLRLYADTDNAIITDDSQSLLKADASKVGIYALELDENGDNKAIFTNGSDITVTTTIDNGNIVDIIHSTVTANKIDNAGEIYANNSTVTAKTMTGNGILFGSGNVGFNTDTNSQRVLIGGYFDENGKMVYHEGEANRSAMTIGDVSGNGVKLTSKEFRTNNTDITLNADVTADLGSGVFLYFRNSTLDLNGNDLTVSSGKFLSTGLDITGSGTVSVDSANDQPCFQTFASSIGADVTFKASKQLCIYEDLTLYGTMINSGNAGNGVTHVGFDDDFWSDGAVFTVSGSKASFTQTGNPGFTIHGADETQDIAKSALVVEDGANFTTDTTVTNYGDIVVDGANFTTAAVVNLGSFSVSGTSVINIGKLSGRDNGQGYTDVTINLAENTVLANGTSITVANAEDYGKVVAAGSITVSANSLKNFDQISVAGDLNITDVVLPADDSVITILDSAVTLDGGAVTVNGFVLDQDNRFESGNNIYQVTVGSNITVEKVDTYTEMSGKITGYKQESNEYIFNLSASVTGGKGEYEYSVKVYADAELTQELDAVGGLQFFLAQDPTVDKIYAVVTVSDDYNSKTLNTVTINVNDYSAPKFNRTALGAALSDMDNDGKANDVTIKFGATDNFAVTSYMIEFNGEKINYTVTDPAQDVEIVRNNIANGDYVVKVTAMDAAGNMKVAMTDLIVNVKTPVEEQPGVVNDFNGDGMSDVIVSTKPLFKVLSSSGNGSEYTTNALALVEDGWTAIGTGYFNNDGFADILLRNDDTGAIEVVYMNNDNGKYTGTQEALETGDAVFNYGDSTADGAEWKIIGIGDVNGDGIDDIIVEKESLMLDANGSQILDSNNAPVKFTEISAFESSYNGEFKQSNSLGGVNPGEWEYIGTADLDGDNKDDIVWMNTETQLVGYWSSANRDAAANAKAGESVDPTWQTLAAGTSDWSFAGIGDFDGDGKGEILWQHDGGFVGFWQELDSVKEDGSTVEFIGLGDASELGKGASIEAIGNYGGDASRDDILWSTATGEKKAWIINSEDYNHSIITVAY